MNAKETAEALIMGWEHNHAPHLEVDAKLDLIYGIAAALIAYGNERLEVAGKVAESYDTYVANVIRDLKEKP